MKKKIDKQDILNESRTPAVDEDATCNNTNHLIFDNGSQADMYTIEMIDITF